MAQGAFSEPEEKEITIISQICKSTLLRECLSTWTLFQRPLLFWQALVWNHEDGVLF